MNIRQLIAETMMELYDGEPPPGVAVYNGKLLAKVAATERLEADQQAKIREAKEALHKRKAG